MEKKEIYLIDGSAYLYRAFHAIRNLSNSRGLPTNATFGVTKMLLKLYRERTPEYAAMFFDVKGPTFRHEIYEQYKANRPPMPDDLVQQIPYIKKIVKALNIPIVEKNGFEADDLIGTYARIAEEKGFQTIMVTGDKDFMQLVTDSTIIWDPMKEKIIDRSYIKKEFDLRPEQIIDMLGLAGDTADNIPGVPGVGQKTALKLLLEYDSIQGIYDNLDNLKSRKAMHKKLSEHREQAFLSQKLVAINRSVDVPWEMEDFKVRPFDNQKLAELFQRLEFRTLQQEFTLEQETPKKDYICLTDIAKIQELVSQLEQSPCFAIDTETTSVSPMRAELVGLSFALKANQAFYIPVGHTGLANSSVEQPDRKSVLEMLKPVLENPAIEKVGQNIKYDYIVLARCGIAMKGIAFDTMIASYLLNPSRRGHSLDQIALDLLRHKTIKYKEITGKGKNQISFSEVEIEKAVDYACEDADITLQAFRILEKNILENGLDSLMRNLEMPLVSVLAHMEMNGIKVDTKKLEALSRRFEQESEQIEKQIFALVGESFNINSSQQLGQILFEKLKLPVQKKTKKENRIFNGH